MSLYGRHGYPIGTGSRDLRFDFLRGFAMLSVVAAHLEMFDWFKFIFWERLGLISAAGLFVAAAGLVLGLVNRRTTERDGLGAVTGRLLRRVRTLYLAQVATVFLVILVARLGLLDMTAVTTFTDRWAGQTYPMIPPPEMPWPQQIRRVLLLKETPHQIQILSLYVVLIALAPLMLWLLHRRWLLAYFGISWALYAVGWRLPPGTLLLGMRFEYAFPVLMYQLLFTHALAVGFFRQEIAARLAHRGTRRAVLAGVAILYLAFFLFAQMTPNHTFPAWSRLQLMSGERWQGIYDVFFVKSHPSPLRLLNVAVFCAAFYALLTYLWVPLNKALGWLLIPLGEASLYVFLMHLVFVVLIDQIPGYFDVIPDWHDVWPVRIWINTALYLGTVLGLWLMVRYKVLFGIVPR